MRNYLPLLLGAVSCLGTLVLYLTTEHTTCYIKQAIRLQKLSTPPQSWVRGNVQRVRDSLESSTDFTNMWNATDPYCTINSYYFPRLGVTYNGVPKVGCSNWLAGLINAEKEENIFPGFRGIYWVHQGWATPYRVHKIIRNQTRWPVLEKMREGVSFSQVRNPWVRMVSGFRDKLSGERVAESGFRPIGVDIVQQARGIGQDEIIEQDLYPTFREFLESIVENQEKNNLNYHFAPQFRSMGLEHINYTFIGSLELIKEQFHEVEILTRANLSIPGSYDASTDPRLEKSTILAKQWFNDIDAQLVNRLYEMFKLDFMLYNYSNFTHRDFPMPLYYQA